MLTSYYQSRKRKQRPGLAALVGVGGPAALTLGMRRLQGVQEYLDQSGLPMQVPFHPSVKKQKTNGSPKIQSRKIHGTRSYSNMPSTLQFKKRRSFKRRGRMTVKQTVRNEVMKTLETKNQLTTGTVTGTPGQVAWPSIAQGAARNQRTGDKIFISRVEVWLRVELAASATLSTNHWANVLLLTPFNDTLDVAQLANTTNLLDFDTDTMFIHYKKQWIFPASLTGQTSVNDNQHAAKEHISHFSVPYNKYVHYNGSAGGDFIKNMIQLGISTSDAQTTVRYNMRVWYKAL